LKLYFCFSLQSIRPLKIGEPTFKEEIHKWAREECNGQTQIHSWVWVYTKDNELLVLPHEVWSAEYEKFTSHTQLALGKPVKSAGEFDLAVTMTSEGDVHVEAKLISNMTGHYWADAPSLYDCAPHLLEALRKAGITTESVEVEIHSY
jgi:hypothetical protein